MVSASSSLKWHYIYSDILQQDLSVPQPGLFYFLFQRWTFFVGCVPVECLEKQGGLFCWLKKKEICIFIIQCFKAKYIWVLFLLLSNQCGPVGLGCEVSGDKLPCPAHSEPMGTWKGEGYRFLSFTAHWFQRGAYSWQFGKGLPALHTQDYPTHPVPFQEGYPNGDG